MILPRVQNLILLNLVFACARARTRYIIFKTNLASSPRHSIELSHVQEISVIIDREIKQRLSFSLSPRMQEK